MPGAPLPGANFAPTVPSTGSALDKPTPLREEIFNFQPCLKFLSALDHETVKPQTPLMKSQDTVC